MPADAPGRAELFAIRAALLAVQPGAPDDPAAARTASEALLGATTGLSPGHPLRSPLFEQLSSTLGRQAADAMSSDDVPAAMERILETLEQLPDDAPQLERTLTALSIQLLNATLAHRSAVPLDRVEALLEKTIKRLEPGNTLGFAAEFMLAGAIGLQGVIEHRPAVLDDAAERMHRSTTGLPGGHVGHIVGLLGQATVDTERYIMSGELHHLEPATKHVEEFIQAAVAAGDTPLGELGRALGHYIKGVLADRQVPARP